MIHIEGMGLLGSLLAINLDARGFAFTWDDNGLPWAAWPASTGLVYPAGDARSMRGLARWHEWLEYVPNAQSVRYVYTHKHPPHEGKYTAEFDLGDMRVAPLNPGCISVNVPDLVLDTRERFAVARRPETWGTPLIRAHGYTERLGSYMWGWSAKVRLDLPDDLLNACAGMRPAFYSRKDRFQIVYAYPVPGEDCWWAGSSLISQKQPRGLDAHKHLARWITAWEANWPRVPLTSIGTPVQGWRPRAAVEPDDDHLVTRQDGTLSLPPLWHSGVRWAPLVIDRTLAMLS